MSAVRFRFWRYHRRAKARSTDAGRGVVSMTCNYLETLGMLPQIIAQAGQAAFAAETGFLVAAERRRRIELVEGVAPDHAGLHPRSGIHPELPARRPNPGTQTVGQIVGAFDRFVGRAEGHNRKDWPKNLLARNTVRRLHVGEEGSRIPVAALGQRAGGLHQVRAFGDPAVDEFDDAVALRSRIDRADIGVLVERIPVAQRLDA